MRKDRFTLVISPCPMNMNRRNKVHWRRVHAEKKRVHKEVWAQLPMWAQAGMDLVPLFDRVRIDLHRIGWNKMDPTALVEILKPVLDSLVDLNVIPDDSEAHVEIGDRTQDIQRPVRGEITIDKIYVTVTGLKTADVSDNIQSRSRLKRLKIQRGGNE